MILDFWALAQFEISRAFASHRPDLSARHCTIWNASSLLSSDPFPLFD